MVDIYVVYRVVFIFRRFNVLVEYYFYLFFLVIIYLVLDIIDRQIGIVYDL